MWHSIIRCECVKMSEQSNVDRRHTSVVCGVRSIGQVKRRLTLGVIVA